MRPLTACTDEAVTLATLARTIRVYLRPWPRTIRVYLRPQKARAQPTPWPLESRLLQHHCNFIKYCPCMPLPRKSYNAISQHIAPATKNDTATSLHSSLTALFLGWTLPWQDPSLIELFLDGTLPWGNSSLTELLLNWTVPWLKSARTVGAKGHVFPEALTLSALAGGGGRAPFFAGNMHGTFIKHSIFGPVP